MSATAAEVQKQNNWTNDAVVQNLKFSNNWVRNFLNRSGMRKRKITRDDKAIPNAADVAAQMQAGQLLYTSHEHSPSNTWNMDETCVTWAIGPLHMYVPQNQQRASNVGIPNTKLRITAVITVNGLGDFAPLMFIIKHSVSSEKKPDQSTMTVIKRMHNSSALKFDAAHGWELLLWEKEMTIKNVTAVHKCWYLRHNVTHHIITSQYKAWNDTTRMMMWVELVMKPIKIRDEKVLLWFDNCGCHKTHAISNTLSELDIRVACLPPNMTAILQVLDLVVNGPLKAHVRNSRANKIVQCFKSYKIALDANDAKDVADRVDLQFVAPKPEMAECIENLIYLFGGNGDFQKTKFKKGITSSFVKTGTIPVNHTDSDDAVFVEYKVESICGTMKVIPLGTRPCDVFDLVEPEMNSEASEIQNMIMSFVDNEFNDHEVVDDNMSDDDDDDNDDDNDA